MTIRTAVLVAASLFGATLAASQSASAISLPGGVRAPQALEDVACRTVRTRSVMPNGRVVFRNVRTCSPGMAMGARRCTIERQRIVRPNGRVVIKSIRRCA
jgi:hypothetical protein